MTLLANLVATSQRVGATSGRLAKIRELAAFLRALAPEEIETGAHYLSGEIPQGRIGIGYATLRAAAGNTPASEAGISLAAIELGVFVLGGFVIGHGHQAWDLFWNRDRIVVACILGAI